MPGPIIRKPAVSFSPDRMAILRVERPTIATLIEKEEWSSAPIRPQASAMPISEVLSAQVSHVDVRLAVRAEVLAEVQAPLVRQLSIDVPPELLRSQLRQTLVRATTPSAVDPVDTTDTATLVRDFEARAGLGVDGILSRDDLLALRSSLTEEDITAELRPMFELATSDWNDEIPPISEGSRGVRVQLLQARLEELGLAPGASEEVMDATTAESVRQYQTAAELQVTGVVDDPTWDALLRDLTPTGPGSSPRYIRALQAVLARIGLGPFEGEAWDDPLAGAVARFRVAAELPEGALFDATAWTRALANHASFFSDAVDEVAP